MVSILAVCSALVLPSGEGTAAAGSGIVRIEMEGLDAGQVLALLFDVEAGPVTDPALACAGTYADCRPGGTDISFMGVPWGEYAVLVFQDLDGDGELDTDDGEAAEPFGVRIETPSPPGTPAADSAGTAPVPGSGEPPSPPEGAGGREAGAQAFGPCSFVHASEETVVEIRILVPAGTRIPGGPGRPGGPGGPPRSQAVTAGGGQPSIETCFSIMALSSMKENTSASTRQCGLRTLLMK